jgi:hypothetical protein
MKAPPQRAAGRELPERAVALAIMVALLALCAALLDPPIRPDEQPAGSCTEVEGGPGYSWPAAPITFVSRLESAAASDIGAEHAPFAQRYDEALSRSGKIDSPLGGPPSRLSHHSTSLYAVGARAAAANIAWAAGSSLRPTTVT